MPLVPLTLPPGIVKPGTQYDARGRWYDASLVRWHEGAMQAIGGWRPLQYLAGSTPTDLSLGDAARGIHAWRSNSQVPHLAFGTYNKAYAYVSGTLTEITPASFTAGVDTATVTYGNYGQGIYGGGDYGSGLAISGAVTEAQNWSFDNFGQLLIACAYSDGKIYSWDLNGANDLTALSGAPTGCIGVVVTPERFVVALGAGGDMRKIQWADQESLTSWTPSPTNQAGDLTLVGSGQIMAARRGRNETLVWTDVDAYVLRYIGGDFVYSLQQVGSGCGLAARRAVGVEGGRAFWMSGNGFFMYDGTVRALPCEVRNYVFSGGLTRAQMSKVACEVRASYSEVTWYYPGTGSSENNRYVTFNYMTGVWSIGELARTAAVDGGVMRHPVAVAPNGNVYEQEVAGATYPNHAGGADLVPYAESGPFEVGTGERVMMIRQIVPDEKTLGSVRATLYASLYPTGTESSQGPFSAANPTVTRLTGRQVRVRVEQVSPGWALGTLRLDVVPGGRR